MIRFAVGVLIAGAIVCAAGAQSIVNVGAEARAAQAPAKAPIFTVDPASVDFGDQVVGQGSASQRLTVTNTGDGPLYVNSVVMGGDNAADFGLSGDACTGSTIEPGKSCVLDVAIAPSATGARNATLTFTHSAPGSPQTIELTGNGINSASAPPR